MRTIRVLRLSILFLWLSGNISEGFSQTIFESAISSGIGNAIKETSDHGFIITGTNDVQLTIVKIDSTGSMLWQQGFGNTSGLHPEHSGNDLLLMPDGGVIAAGLGHPINLTTFAYFIRTDSVGNQIWDLKVYSDIDSMSDEFFALKISQASNGEIIAAGVYHDRVSNLRDYVLIKLDTLGHLINKSHVNAGLKEYLSDFIITDTAYYFLGFEYDGNGNAVSYITKTDTSGNILVHRQFGSYQGIEIAYSFLLEPNEFFVTTGIANYMTQYYFLNRYSMAGDTLFAYNFQVDTTWQVCYSLSVKKLQNKYFLAGELSGFSPDEAVLICADSSGNLLFQYLFGGSAHDNFNKLEITSDSNLIAVGHSSSFGSRQVYVVKADANLLLKSDAVENPKPYIIMYSDNKVIIKFSDGLNKNIILYDITGRIIFERKVDNYFILSEEEYKSGWYLISILTGKDRFTEKIYLLGN